MSQAQKQKRRMVCAFFVEQPDGYLIFFICVFEGLSSRYSVV